MSVAMTRTGEPAAIASPVAPSVLAAPGPVVTTATPSLPVAWAYPSAAYAAVCSCRTPTRRICGLSAAPDGGASGGLSAAPDGGALFDSDSAFQIGRLCTPE